MELTKIPDVKSKPEIHWERLNVVNTWAFSAPIAKQCVVQCCYESQNPVQIKGPIQLQFYYAVRTLLQCMK